MGCSLVKSVFLCTCVIERIVDHALRRLPLSKNASVIVVTESKINDQFTLTVFS